MTISAISIVSGYPTADGNSITVQANITGDSTSDQVVIAIIDTGFSLVSNTTLSPNQIGTYTVSHTFNGLPNGEFRAAAYAQTFGGSPNSGFAPATGGPGVTLPAASSGPTISNVTGTANGQSVTVSANITPSSGAISSALAYLDSVPSGTTLGPFAMTVGTAPAYSYTFTNVPPGTWTPKVSATDSAATSPQVSGSNFTIQGLGGNPQAPNPLTGTPNPLTGTPIISFAVGTGSYSVAENTRDVCLVNLVDIDHASGHTWQLAGADAALFEVVAEGLSWRVRKLTNFDFENPQDAGANNVYNLTISATDPASNVSNLMAIEATVTNQLEIEGLRIEPPTLAGLASGDSFQFVAKAFADGVEQTLTGTWSVVSGSGAIGSTGLFLAGSNAGPVQIKFIPTVAPAAEAFATIQEIRLDIDQNTLSSVRNVGGVLTGQIMFVGGIAGRARVDLYYGQGQTKQQTFGPATSVSIHWPHGIVLEQVRAVVTGLPAA